jgi:uncharacterized caspase-like protein
MFGRVEPCSDHSHPRPVRPGSAGEAALELELLDGLDGDTHRSWPVRDEMTEHPRYRSQATRQGRSSQSRATLPLSVTEL